MTLNNPPPAQYVTSDDLPLPPSLSAGTSSRSARSDVSDGVDHDDDDDDAGSELPLQYSIEEEDAGNMQSGSATDTLTSDTDNTGSTTFPFDNSEC